MPLEKQVALHLEHFRPSGKLGSLSTARRALLALVSTPCAPRHRWMRSRHDTCSRRQGTSQSAVRGPRPPRAHGPRSGRLTAAFHTPRSTPTPRGLLDPIVLPPPVKPAPHQPRVGLRASDSPAPRGTAARPWRAHVRRRGRRVPSPAKYISRNECAAAARHLRSERPRGREARPGGGGAPRVGLQRCARSHGPQPLRPQTGPAERPSWRTSGRTSLAVAAGPTTWREFSLPGPSTFH